MALANEEFAQWRSVHVCPKCDHIVDLAEIDLKAATTGIIVCSKCDWSGPIEIEILEKRSVSD
jgi:hypothetical protein